MSQMKTIKLLFGALVMAGVHGGIASAADAPPGGEAAKVNFQDHVLPIFRNACLNCHNADRKRGGLDISSFGATITGSDGQKVVAPGDPDSSVLYKVVAHLDEPKMPQRADKLPAKDIETIKQWIAQGALENAGSKAAAVAKPKLALTVEPSATGKPQGEPAMPQGLSTEPVVKAKRAGAITALAASPWAPVAAIGGQKQILLYHSQTLELLGVLPFPEGFPGVVKFSRNGSLLLAGGGIGAKSGKVVLFDVKTGKRIGEVGDEYDVVLAADISPDQSKVVLGGPSKLVKVLATADGQVQAALKKHTDWVTAIAFSPDGKFIASADRAGGLVVWDAESATELFVLAGHRGGVTDVAFRGDSKVLASSSEDGTVKLWDLEEGKQLKTWNAHAGGAMSVGFAHDGRLVSAGRDKAVKTWGGDGSAGKTLEAMGDIALRVAFDFEGKRVIGGDFGGVVRVWEAGEAKKVGELDANPPTAAERVALVQKKLSELAAAQKKASAELEAARAAAAKVEAEVKAAQSAVAEKEKALAAAQEAVKRLTGEIEVARKGAEAKTTALKPAQEKLKALEASAKEAQAKFKGAQEELERLKGPKLQAAAQ